MLKLSPTVCTMKCSKAEKVIPLVSIDSFSQCILYLENWLLFWYYCGLHEKNHLLRNLFFYASAVNVHIVAVWCYMIKKQSGLCWWGSQWKDSVLPEIFHQYISDFTRRKLLQLCWFPNRRAAEQPDRKGNNILNTLMKMLPHPLVYWLILGKLLSSPHVWRENHFLYIHTLSF